MQKEGASKICYSCGKAISVTAKICPHCNVDAFERDAKRAYSQIEDMDTEHAYIPAKKRRAAIKAVLELFVVAGIMYFIYASGYINIP